MAITANSVHIIRIERVTAQCASLGVQGSSRPGPHVFLTCKDLAKHKGVVIIYLFDRIALLYNPAAWKFFRDPGVSIIAS